MQTKRYPGVRPFETADKDLFFGRERDVQDLSVLVSLEKLVVLFGRSGYGKSSIINAGLIPELTKSADMQGVALLPVVTRLGSYAAGSRRSPVEKLLDSLNDVCPDNPESSFMQSLVPDPTLWFHFKQKSGDTTRFLLIFDQFEEFFTYPAVQQEDFKSQLAELLYTDMPQIVRENARDLDKTSRRFLSGTLDIKVLFVIRDDRLSQLNNLKDKLPSILHKSFELKALSESQARSAIEKPAEKQGDFLSPAFTFSPDALDLIIQKLGESRHADQHAGIEAFQLQILCEYLENKVATGDVPANRIETAHFADRIENIYEGYCDRLLKKLPPHLVRPAQNMIENDLIFTDRKTSEPRRLSVDADSLVQKYAHTGISFDTLRDLENTFLLRRLPNSVGSHSYELSHDTLIKPILNLAEKRQQTGQKKRRLAIYWASGILFIAFLSHYFISTRNAATQSDSVIQENKVLKQELGLIQTAMNREDSVRQVVRRYFECVTKRDVACISTYCADTMEQYYRVRKMPKSDREREEKRYFNKHPEAMGWVPENNDISIAEKDARFLVNVSTKFNDKNKGVIPLIYQIQLGSAMKITVLRSYVPKETINQ